MGINVQLQTEFRDGESQTYSVDFVVPEPWQRAHPDPWVLAGNTSNVFFKYHFLRSFSNFKFLFRMN